jgi:hypothetical protein
VKALQLLPLTVYLAVALGVVAVVGLCLAMAFGGRDG